MFLVVICFFGNYILVFFLKSLGYVLSLPQGNVASYIFLSIGLLDLNILGHLHHGKCFSLTMVDSFVGYIKYVGL